MSAKVNYWIIFKLILLNFTSRILPKRSQFWTSLIAAISLSHGSTTLSLSLKSDKKLKKHEIVCTREFNRSINTTIHSLTGQKFFLKHPFLYKASSYEQHLSSELYCSSGHPFTSQNKDRGAVCLPLLGRHFSFHVIYLSQGHGRSQPASQLRARKNNGIV